MAKKHVKTEFDGLYQGVEELEEGVGVAYTRKGHYSVFIRMDNPVVQYSANITEYYEATALFENIIKSLGDGYSLQKQDIFSRQAFDPKIAPDAKFLNRAYMNFFRGREYTEVQTCLIITQEIKQTTFGLYDRKREEDFWNKVQKIRDLLSQKKINYHMLNAEEIIEYLHRYLGVSFRRGAFSYSNFKTMDNYVQIGDRSFRIINVVDIDEVVMPAKVCPFGYEGEYPVDMLAFLAKVPGADCVIYTQTIIIPPQRKEVAKLQANYNRKKNVKDPGNQMAAQDIKNLMDDLATDGKILVQANFCVMIVVKGDAKALDKPYNFVEKKFYDQGIGINQCAYNQMELFISMFPGNQLTLKSYERFLCPHDAAVCFFFKEYIKGDEKTPCKVYYTNRQGVPVAIDFTGKEGDIKYTTNSNLFALGPSGSGKSFHMNSVVRQLREQDTDVVMVDTGNSYEGVCSYFNGTYIAYTEEKPITMNPFRITLEENNIEKRNFLKSLVLLIWKGADARINNVEEMLIDTVIAKYYEYYFTPFQGFDDEQKEQLRNKLLLEKRHISNEDRVNVNATKEKKKKALDTYLKLEALAEKGEDGEAQNAAILKSNTFDTLMKLNVTEKEINEYREAKLHNREYDFLDEDVYLMHIDGKIDRYEKELKNIHVRSLSFNTFYEFCMQYIPIECEQNNLEFDMHTFSYTLKPFYKGGAREKTLNDDLDNSLFEQSFIVFEIDAIKDDKLLFPIVTLIIMDVFIQKMRLKKNRKALIIEEAWKAIASPLMAEYIKYLYKTVRKFWGMVGVVTQELDDIISNETVKSTIINNSEVTILLDQAKYRDNFADIKKLLGLSDVECHKIWSINNLDNHENRAYFKEVYIRRGQWGEVFGCEESPESYMAYTTERMEKDALKIYIKRMGDYEKGIEAFCADQAELFPPFTKADKYANIVNTAVRLYNMTYGEGKKGEAQFLKDWIEFDERYQKSMTKQIFPNHIVKENQVWNRK